MKQLFHQFLQEIIVRVKQSDPALGSKFEATFKAAKDGTKLVSPSTAPVTEKPAETAAPIKLATPSSVPKTKGIPFDRSTEADKMYQHERKRAYATGEEELGLEIVIDTFSQQTSFPVTSSEKMARCRPRFYNRVCKGPDW